jgi:hypothetical protein
MAATSPVAAKPPCGPRWGRGYAIPYHQPFDHAQNVQLANYTARSLIISKSVPSVIYYSLHMGTYEGLSRTLKQQNRRSTDSHPVLDLGLWKNELDDDGKMIYLPRPAVAAYATTARLLAFTTDPQQLTPKEGVCCYVFDKEGRALAALWTTDQPVTVEMNLSAPAEQWDLMGNRTVLPAGRVEVGLSQSPVFVLSPTKPEQLKETLGKMKFPPYAKGKGSGG